MISRGAMPTVATGLIRPLNTSTHRGIVSPRINAQTGTVSEYSKLRVSRIRLYRRFQSDSCDNQTSAWTNAIWTKWIDENNLNNGER